MTGYKRVTAKPAVARRRKKRQNADLHTRTELARGDMHRNRSQRQREATGTWTKAGRPQAEHEAKRQAAARRQPRDALGRFTAIVRAEDRRLYDEAIWGRKTPRRYAKASAKARGYTGKDMVSVLRRHRRGN